MKLRTPEEIYKQHQNCRELQKSEAIEMIKTAQREAIEAAANSVKMKESDRCIYCGADYGLHQSETNKCPRNGVEETRIDKNTGHPYPQRWSDTIFTTSEEIDKESILKLLK